MENKTAVAFQQFAWGTLLLEAHASFSRFAHSLFETPENAAPT